MNGQKARRARRMTRMLGHDAVPRQYVGDGRTVRYWYDVPVAVEMTPVGARTHYMAEKVEHELPDDSGAVPLFATYTLRNHPGSVRGMYRMAKRGAAHG